jgi:hypothetical protein
MMADDEAEKFSRGYTEDALVRVELPLVLPQRCKSLFKIGDERVRFSGFNSHVIHKSFNVLVEQFLEIGLDSSLIGGAGVLQPE